MLDNNKAWESDCQITFILKFYIFVKYFSFFACDFCVERIWENDDRSIMFFKSIWINEDLYVFVCCFVSSLQFSLPQITPCMSGVVLAYTRAHKHFALILSDFVSVFLCVHRAERVTLNACIATQNDGTLRLRALSLHFYLTPFWYTHQPTNTGLRTSCWCFSVGRLILALFACRLL